MSSDAAEVDQPDLSRHRRTSMWAAASYVLVFLVLGLPVWWRTTDVYRVALPYDQIDSMGFAVMRAEVLLVAPQDAPDQVGQGLQQALKDSPVYSYYLSLRAPSPEEAKRAAEATMLEDLDAALAPLHANVLTGTVILLQVGPELLGKGVQVAVGNGRTVFFSPEADPKLLASVVREVVLGESAIAKTLDSIEEPSHKKMLEEREGQEDKTAPKSGAAGRGDRGVLRRVPAAAGYDLLFSLLVPEPEKIMVEWDAPAAVESYVKPFVRALENVTRMSVKSQVLYLQKLNLKHKKRLVPAVGPGTSPDHNVEVNVVGQKALGLAINPVESQLASHVSSNPRLNFLVYVPMVEQTPLRIESEEELLDSNAFLLPRWGGVLVHNMEDAAALFRSQRQRFDSVRSEVDMGPVMGTFLAQLRLLLGLQDYQPLSEVRFLPLTMAKGQAPIREWERDFLTRLRTLENLHLARATLQSLAHLLSQIPNMVIGDEVGERVHSAVRECAKTSDELGLGRLDRALEASMEAFVDSDTAFFDPSLLELLYFPEDQKYAIYIPLFIPVGIPVVMSIKSLFNYFREGAKAKVD